MSVGGAKKWGAFGALAGLILAGYLWLLPVDKPDFAPALPTEANSWLMTASTTDLVADLQRFSRQIRGASALPDAIGALIGLQTFDQAQLAAHGISRQARLTCFVWRDQWWGWIATEDRRRDETWPLWLKRRGFQIESTGSLWVVTEAGQSSPVALIHLLKGQALIHGPLPGTGLDFTRQPAELTPTWPSDDLKSFALAELTQWQQASKRAWTTGSTLTVHVDVKAASHAKARARALLGPAALLFGGVVDAIESIEAKLNLASKSPALTLRLNTHKGANRAFYDYYVAPFDKGPTLALGEVLPDETSFWTLVHINPKLLKWVPNFLLKRVLPADVFGHIDSRFAAIDLRTELVQRWNGRLALGFLGLNDDFRLPTGIKALLRGWSHMGFFVGLGLDEPAAAAALPQAILAACDGTRDCAQEVSIGPWKGVTLQRDNLHVSCLHRDNNLLWIFGQGELERFYRVQRGRFPSWKGAADNELELAIGQDGHGWMKAALSTGRISRAVRRRGVPDTVVQMLRSVAAIAGRMVVDVDGFEVSMRLRPRQQVDIP
ncbi:MAG TPA: hypothetical protein DCQ06_09515 [Myxococcales bacterium]|nr:hypothetical protein [Myxococcales bacterium]